MAGGHTHVRHLGQCEHALPIKYYADMVAGARHQVSSCLQNKTKTRNHQTHRKLVPHSQWPKWQK